MMQPFPSLDVQNGVLRAWWIDPMVATVAFGIFINWYWYHERRLGLSSSTSFRETIGVELGPLWSSLVAYWAGIVFWKLVIPPAATEIPDGLPTDVMGGLYLLLEVVSGIVLYDFVMFFLHWAMHEVPLLRSWHHRHHAFEGRLESRDTLRHSLVDGSLQVLVNIMVQRHTPWGLVKSRLARVCHNMLVIWMLVESHTSSPTPYIWRKHFVGIREHHNHHLGSQYSRHQQFFGYLDDLRLAWSSYRVSIASRP